MLRKERKEEKLVEEKNKEEEQEEGGTKEAIDLKKNEDSKTSEGWRIQE